MSKSCLTLCNSYGLLLVRPLCPWAFPGTHTGIGCHFLLQEIFLTQGWYPSLLYWQASSLPLSHQGSWKYIYLFSSVAQSCLTLCDPMDCSTPGFLVHHQLPELAQTHVHRVGNAIQPSHPLLSLSFSPLNLFHWVSSLHQGARVLKFQL